MPNQGAPSNTQESESSQSNVEFNWIITFDWRESSKNPFEVFQRSCFSGREIPVVWYTKVLSKARRLKKLKLSGLPGPFYTVFCKVELGKL